jgi:hypothetical protein
MMEYEWDFAGGEAEYKKDWFILIGPPLSTAE